MICGAEAGSAGCLPLAKPGAAAESTYTPATVQAAMASGNGAALLQQLGLDEATAQALALSMQPQPFDPADDAADQLDDDYAGAWSMRGLLSACWRLIMGPPNHGASK
jgi:hypothetical protein